MADLGGSIGAWGFPLAIMAGVLRGSVPFLFVSLGECLTEKSGRINLGMEGTLLLGGVTAFAVSVHTRSPWLGVLAAGGTGILWGSLYAWLVQWPRINDISMGIAMTLLGSGLAFFVGKAYIQPTAPQLPALDLGWWCPLPAVQSALMISPLLLLGIALAGLLYGFFHWTRWGLMVRAVGENPQAARAMGIPVKQVQVLCIILGSLLAGIGGAYLTLYFPGTWTERISRGQGLMAVALVIFARWNPLQCLGAAFLFGGTQGMGPALQSVGIESFYQLFNATPYILTLAVMVITCSPHRPSLGAPAALGKNEES